MAMNYSSLIAAKGNTGSIANWVSYTLLDIPPILEEAQTLIFSLLRTREMLAATQFSMAVNESYVALPARFLDPIGRITMSSFGIGIRHKDSSFIQQARSYTELSGTLGANPFTTVLDSSLVTVALTGSGFTQDSVFNVSGATAVGGITPNGTFPITAIASDGNSFTIDVSSVGTATSSATGGGSAAAYLVDNLTQGIPNWFGIWNERIYFDVALVQQALCRMQFYQSPALLSTSNETNFLTNRYPQLIRVATDAAAADFMKDDSEYTKAMTRLGLIVDRINIENDMSMRGMELDTLTP